VLEHVQRAVQALGFARHCREPRLNIPDGFFNYGVFVLEHDTTGRKLEEDAQGSKPSIQSGLGVCER
jgi:hypothetical protein